MPFARTKISGSGGILHVETILGEAKNRALAQLARNGGCTHPITPSRVLRNGLNRLDSFEILRRRVDWFDLFCTPVIQKISHTIRTELNPQVFIPVKCFHDHDMKQAEASDVLR